MAFVLALLALNAVKPYSGMTRTAVVHMVAAQPQQQSIFELYVASLADDPNRTAQNPLRERLLLAAAEEHKRLWDESKRLAERTAELVQVKAHAAELLAGKDAAIASKDAAIAGKDAAIAGKDAAIAGMEAAIAGKEEAKNVAIEYADKAIAGKDAAIAGKDEALEFARMSLDSQNKETAQAYLVLAQYRCVFQVRILLEVALQLKYPRLLNAKGNSFTPTTTQRAKRFYAEHIIDANGELRAVVKNVAKALGCTASDEVIQSNLATIYARLCNSVHNRLEMKGLGPGIYCGGDETSVGCENGIFLKLLQEDPDVQAAGSLLIRELNFMDSLFAHVFTFKPDGTIVALDGTVIFDIRD
ncbi:hypothetical protein KFE25_002228 [Diacronema lutheri]|uniref:Uncharacterized protein n=1 Tax=Diacronema lutheri TaxID=2081491 RepID=A0A8J5XQF2_DIALT|nr:hypothetical protein KFE25_002228 [Diacronema lutheri]